VSIVHGRQAIRAGAGGRQQKASLLRTAIGGAELTRHVLYPNARLQKEFKLAIAFSTTTDKHEHQTCNLCAVGRLTVSSATLHIVGRQALENLQLIFLLAFFNVQGNVRQLFDNDMEAESTKIFMNQSRQKK
jgi:hypothetical protein